MNPEKPSSFDAAAKSYDENFTLSEIGKRQRERVYYWLNKSKALETTKSIFELNCGTGYDAAIFQKLGFQVVATDASMEMLRVAKSKRSKEIEFYQLEFNALSSDNKVAKSDLVFSNFGGLNCLDEKALRLFFEALSMKQTKGNQLVLVIMPKHCPIEDLYLLLKGKLLQMGRRNRHDFLEVDVNGEKVKTFYHSPHLVKNILSKSYKIKLVKPVASFLPPSYTEPFFKRNAWLLKGLYFLERTFGRFNFLAAKADHYILIAERK